MDFCLGVFFSFPLFDSKFFLKWFDLRYVILLLAKCYHYCLILKFRMNWWLFKTMQSSTGHFYIILRLHTHTLEHWHKHHKLASYFYVQDYFNLSIYCDKFLHYKIKWLYLKYSFRMVSNESQLKKNKWNALPLKYY